MGDPSLCSRRGKFVVLRQTMRRRWQAKLREVKAELRQRMHEPVPEMGRYLRSVVGGYVRYHGVPRSRSVIFDRP